MKEDPNGTGGSVKFIKQTISVDILHEHAGEIDEKTGKMKMKFLLPEEL